MALTQISTGGIKDDAVTDAKLPANSVGNSEMKDDAVGVAELSATGTASSSTFLRGDNSWVTPTDTNTQLAFANDANNRVVTGDGSGGLNGEANLTYDGTTLKNSVAAENGSFAHFELSGQTNNPALVIKADESDQKITFRAGASTSTYPSIAFDMGTVGDAVTIDPSGNLDVQGTISYGPNNKGRIYTDNNWGTIFQADKASPNNAEFMWENAGDTERLRIDNSGNLKINDGDLVIGTSGHGIDFSATGDGSGTTTSELLDGYEEGSFTPTIAGGLTSISYGEQHGYYVKVGKVVHVSIRIQVSGTTNSTALAIGGLPFTSSNQNGRNYTSGGISFCNMPLSSADFDPYITYNSTQIKFYEKVSGSNVICNSSPSNKYIGVGAFYFTDA